MIRVASESITITPRCPVVLGASVNPDVKSSGVHDALEANVLALLTESDEDPVVLVSLDLLYTGRVIRESIEAVLAPLHPSRILVFASHTHRAPMTDDTKPNLGELEASYARRIGTEVGSAAERVRARVIDGARCELHAAVTTVNHSVNRRRPSRKGIRLAPNWGGSRDEEVTILEGKDEIGRTRFVLWNYACHPVAFPAPKMVSSHFPHVVRSHIRASRGCADLPVLFLQGFSGDTRPLASGMPQTVRQRLRNILVGPRFYNMTWESYHEWSVSLACAVTSALSSAARIETEQILVERRVVDANEFVSAAGVDLDPVSLHGVAFGPNLFLIGVSAEVVSEYATQLRKIYAATQLMLGGCLDHTIGYVPTQAMLSEGGYEASGYCRFFQISNVRPEVEERTMRLLRAVADSLERRLEGSQ